jgi:hypothetical protein
VPRARAGFLIFILQAGHCRGMEYATVLVDTLWISKGIRYMQVLGQGYARATQGYLNLLELDLEMLSALETTLLPKILQQCLSQILLNPSFNFI